MLIVIAMELTDGARIELEGVFAKYPEVLAVYLFGSHATGRARRDSDVDLAVVSTPLADARSRRLDILADLAHAGFDNVDLSFLDRGDVVLCHEAVRLNRVLFERPEFDRGAWYSRVVRMYLDFVPYLRTQRQALKERLLHGSA